MLTEKRVEKAEVLPKKKTPAGEKDYAHKTIKPEWEEKEGIWIDTGAKNGSGRYGI